MSKQSLRATLEELHRVVEQLDDRVDPYDTGACTETAKAHVEGFRERVLREIALRLDELD